MKLNFIKISFFLIALAACGEKDIVSEKKSDLSLIQKTFVELPGWQNDNHGEALEAFLLSCEKITKTKKEYLGNSEIKIATKEYIDICLKAQNIKSENFKNFIESNFEPFLIEYKGSAEGKFTAYYEPLIKVNYNQDETYKYPIHAKPLDLIEFNPRDFDSSMPSKRLVGRLKGQKLVPYYTRDEIGKGLAKAPVLLWSDSFVDVYIMHIQGPAVAEFPDGSQIRISYADNNGLPFKGIGSILLKNGELAAGKASMLEIKKWLLENPKKAINYMNQNPRYIFHQLIGASGPLGALNTPLVAGRSLAVDARYIPLGSLLWLDTTKPDGKPLQRLINAQDVGGAIKGAIRGDYFWGSGGDDILELAGKMNQKGSYYILLPKKGE